MSTTTIDFSAAAEMKLIAAKSSLLACGRLEEDDEDDLYSLIETSENELNKLKAVATRNQLRISDPDAAAAADAKDSAYAAALFTFKKNERDKRDKLNAEYEFSRVQLQKFNNRKLYPILKEGLAFAEIDCSDVEFKLLCSFLDKAIVE
jgi:hypothetical protein